jgi:two-component system, chemotaxis family, protein-glutamate methylesterase/glutaminase
VAKKKTQNHSFAKNSASPKRIIVVGTSAGGLDALVKLVSQFQVNIPAAVLIVYHISADATGNVLLDSMKANSKLICSRAKDGEAINSGHLYIAPSDHHLMITKTHKITVTKGAHENRSRPAIDPLFRSAAVAFGNKVIGIILTGYLDDGTSGLLAIKRCGGICIVQDPEDALFPDMPQNALRQVNADYCIPIAEMGSILAKLFEKKLGKSKKVPKDIRVEAEIATRVLSDLKSVNELGDQVPFNCPGCGGVLWKVQGGDGIRFRCHTGHAYTAVTLLAEQNRKLEETMWTALRMFEERKNLLMTMAQEQSGSIARSAKERAALSDVHIKRIRMMLQADHKGTSDDIPV